MSKKDKKIDKIKELYQEQAFSQVIIEGQELLEKEKNRSAKRVLYNYIGLALRKFSIAWSWSSISSKASPI